ncbi:MAG: ATP-dependent Clp protease ATP-binding subunit ClpC [Actinomycetota bacterium]|jgi:ATP-dependent Clp protease ATP-binding subunit ClpC|nr:ATP-dependent Clp protease ATP-binding subunit ClpC [Actinomycetota bacterium]
MFERFTDRARRVVVLAQEESRLLNHNYIGTEHLLLGLIHEGEGFAAQALERLGVSLERVRAEVEEIIGQGASSPSGHIPFTPRAKKVLELSLREALELGHNYIGTEHILLGLLREGEGVAAQVLVVRMGADLGRVREVVVDMVSSAGGMSESTSPVAGSDRHLRLRVRPGRIDLSLEDPSLMPFPTLDVVVRAQEVVSAGSRELFEVVRRIVGQVGRSLDELESKVAFDDPKPEASDPPA